MKFIRDVKSESFWIYRIGSKKEQNRSWGLNNILWM